MSIYINNRDYTATLGDYVLDESGEVYLPVSAALNGEVSGIHGTLVEGILRLDISPPKNEKIIKKIDVDGKMENGRFKGAIHADTSIGQVSVDDSGAIGLSASFNL